MIQKSDPQDMVSDTNGNNLYYDIYIYIYIERERERERERDSATKKHDSIFLRR